MPGDAPGAGEWAGRLASADLRAWELGNQFVMTVKLMLRIRHHHEQAMAAADSAVQPLLFSLRHGPMRVSDLAESVHSEVSTVSRQTKDLARAGLVDKVHAEGDRRVQLVRLTAAGAEVACQAALERTEWFARVLTGWDTSDVEAFRAHLERFSLDVERVHREDSLAQTSTRLATTSSVSSDPVNISQQIQ